MHHFIFSEKDKTPTCSWDKTAATNVKLPSLGLDARQWVVD